MASKQAEIVPTDGVLLSQFSATVLVQVISNAVTTTTNFDNLDPSIRQCKSKSETEGLKSLNQYTKVGCEFECALKKASNLCKCLPWFLATDFKGNLNSYFQCVTKTRFLYRKPNTPPIAEIIWVKNVRAIVVCGFLIRLLKMYTLKI